MPKTSEIYEKALKLVKLRWCQKAYARDAQGRDIYEIHPAADSFCSLGGLYRARYDMVQAEHDTGILFSDFPSNDVLKAPLEKEINRFRIFKKRSIGNWNDDPKRKQSEVVKVFETVIRKLKEQNL